MSAPSNTTKANLIEAARKEVRAGLDSYEADLTAALLGKPLPLEGVPLDLTPPDDEESMDDEAL